MPNDENIPNDEIALATLDDDSTERSEALIDETLKASFPASDPPAWNFGIEDKTERASANAVRDTLF